MLKSDSLRKYTRKKKFGTLRSSSQSTSRLQPETSKKWIGNFARGLSLRGVPTELC
jgi:hypothetical protein